MLKVIDLIKTIIILLVSIPISYDFNVITNNNMYTFVAFWFCFCFICYLSNKQQKNILLIASSVYLILSNILIGVPSPPINILSFFGYDKELLMHQHMMKYFMVLMVFMAFTAVPLYFYRDKKIPIK